jgi:hypothetical protein
VGVIYKLKPEIADFIIEQKKKDNLLSCRKLTILILETFQIKVSKSSINIVMKEAGLSAPVGRTPKKRRKRITMPVLPVLEDAVVKDSQKIAEEAAKLEQERWLRLAEVERLLKESQEKARQEEEARKAQEAAQRKEAEEEKAKVLAQQKAIEEAERRAREEAEALLQAKDAELKKVEEEAQRIAEEAKKAEEERWARLAEVERLLKESQEKARLEEERIKELEQAQKAQVAEARIKEEESQRKAAQDQARLEAQQKAKEEAERRVKEEEAALRLVMAQQEAARQEEIRKQKEEEVKPAVPSPSFFSSDLIDNSGLIILKAVDALIGGSKSFIEIFSNRLGKWKDDISPIVENLLFLPLIEKKLDKQSLDVLYSYFEDFNNVKVLSEDMADKIGLLLKQVRCLKLSLADNTAFYIDGQMYSVWPTPHIPYDFSTPIAAARMNMDKFFNADNPLVLFNAPGQDEPAQEFFKLISVCESQVNAVAGLTYYGQTLEELDTSALNLSRNSMVIFGLWPWQFALSRRVNKIGEFREFKVTGQSGNLYIADIDFVLIDHVLGREFSLYGCALKTSLNDKTRLVILTNRSVFTRSSEELVSIYLKNWPNLQESLQDYNRKIELFNYAASSLSYFSAENININLSSSLSVKELFSNYLYALDAYVRWSLLPAEYQNKPLKELYDSFYGLKANLSKDQESISAKFILDPGYAYTKDLEYLCRRINERKIFLADGLRLRLSLS